MATTKKKTVKKAIHSPRPAPKEAERELWEAYEDQFDSRPVGYLVTEAGNIDRMMAYIPIPRHRVDANWLYNQMAESLDIALSIKKAQAWEDAVDSIDLREFGRVDSKQPTPDFLYGLSIGKVGSRDRIALEPFCQFRFKRDLKRYFDMRFSAEHRETYQRNGRQW